MSAVLLVPLLPLIAALIVSVGSEATRHARAKIAAWVDDYNTGRPHSALGYATPAAFAARCAASAPELLSAKPQATPPLQQHSGPLTQDPLIQAGT